MNRPVPIVLTSILLTALLQAAPVAAKKPQSTPEERAKAVQLTRELERDPMVQDGPEKRSWLVEFFTKAPDISITMCNLFGPMPGEDHPFFPQVLTQSLFSMGTFIIEHPDKAKDEVAVQTAGMEGALKVYEIHVKAQPEGRLPFLDDLLKKRDAGTLADSMKEAVPKACK